MKIKSIGTIKTPYTDKAPYQPQDYALGDFMLILKPEYSGGLKDLEKFRYCYVLFYMDKTEQHTALTAHPPWLNGKAIGLFASRSPNRPNPIGLSIVKIKSIEKNIIRISPIDALDGTPLLDIKPYIKDLDSKKDAGYGWLDKDAKGLDHLLLHIKGVPHEH